MAEFVSALVGIVSFGVQVTKGLVDYYSSWKDQDSDIAQLCTSLENLTRILNILSDTLQKGSPPSTQIQNSFVENFKHVEMAMERLKKELKGIQEADFSKPGAKSILRKHIRRSFYPFKKKTIKEVQEPVAVARSNLNTILQLLQIDNGIDIHSEVHMLVRMNKENQSMQIRNWISPVNFWLRQEDVLKQRASETGKWLLENPYFLEWEKGNTNVLWLRGNPGVGKTVLASTAIEFLEDDLSAPNIGLAFIYCNHKENMVQNTEYFLGAIARQLVERMLEIPSSAQTLYQSHLGKGTFLNKESLLSLIKEIVAGYSEVYIVIDALDECIDNKGRIFWNSLLSDLKKAIPNIHLLVTSRHIGDTRGVLSDSAIIDVYAVNSDINAYIREQIALEESLYEKCQEECGLEDKIVSALASRADGIFLAVELYLQVLVECTTRKALKKVLSDLPPKLDVNYEDAMARIKRRQTKALALRALAWVVYAVRPLKVKELQHAIAIDELEPDDGCITEDCLTAPQTIVNACAGLIRIDQEERIVSLVHKTTQEYFDRTGKTHFPNGQYEISLACLKYLLLDDLLEIRIPILTLDFPKKILRENALLKYAAQNFGRHLPEDFDFKDQVWQKMAFNFLRNKRRILLAYIAALDEKPRSQPLDAIHYVAAIGDPRILGFLVTDSNVDINLKDSGGRTPLSYAARLGCDNIVAFLLNADGVDQLKTPFHDAVHNGYINVAKMLIESGKVGLSTNNCRSDRLLHDAVRFVYKELVRLLLAIDGIDVNSKNDTGRTPLMMATGDPDMLEMQVDVNFKSLWGHTPISMALEDDDIACAELLLKTGKVDVNYVDKEGRSPLSIAAKSRHENNIALLMLETCEVDVVSTLDWARASGHKDLVELLEARGT